MTDLTSDNEHLYQRVTEILATARRHVGRTVNSVMVHAYWHVGREIVEVEQRGEARAGYGDQLITHLAGRLSKRFGRGMGVATLRRIRRFYLTYPHGTAISDEPDGSEIRSTPLIESGEGRGPPTPTTVSDDDKQRFPPALSWSHYLVLIRVKDEQARAFYEIEAAKETWSVRELERQIGSLLFERLAKSRGREDVMSLAKQGQTVSKPMDVIKDPFVLEFLDLKERSSWLERDLEQAIIDQLESFLLELGKGFCFVARQKRLTLDGDHF